ncbi:MAG: hypothetical protein ABI193_18420 [Minicystis sp.]
MSNPKKKSSPSPAVDPSPPATIAPAAVMNAAAAHAGLTIKPPSYDPVKAKATLETFRSHLAAIPEAEIAIPRLDVRAAALAAVGVYSFVTQDETLHARFEKLHEIGEFEIANIETLKVAAFIVLYAHAQAEAAGALETDAKVPARLVQDGIEVEARMQELCEYKFKRDAKIVPRLQLLRPGTGHRDLAGDLFGYADIYEMRPEEVASETTNYVATDVADARRIAGEILAHLSAAMSPKAREAYDLLLRAWTFLLRTYAEVQEVGSCLNRRDPKRDDWFPSLFAAGRTGRPRKAKGAGAGEDGAKPKSDGAAPPAG